MSPQKNRHSAAARYSGNQSPGTPHPDAAGTRASGTAHVSHADAACEIRNPKSEYGSGLCLCDSAAILAVVLLRHAVEEHRIAKHARVIRPVALGVVEFCHVDA